MGERSLMLDICGTPGSHSIDLGRFVPQRSFLLLVVMPGATSSVLAPSSDALRY